MTGARDLLEVSVNVDGEAAEAVCELFERHGGGAVVETLVTTPTAGHVTFSPTVTVRTYLDAHDTAARARIEVGLYYLSRIHPLPEAAIQVLSEANWGEAWKAHAGPIAVGNRLYVVPSWLADQAPEDRLAIRIDPGMAFGTGLHPTTRLCLAALEDLVRPGSSVLDVGTGSGILAIAAAHLGAASVVGCDTDPRAAEIARANADANGVRIDVYAGGMEAVPGDGEEVRRFDVVTANLLAVIIQDLAVPLAKRVQPGGWLVASGILDDQAEATIAALEAAGLAASGMDTEGDWVALRLAAPERENPA